MATPVTRGGYAHPSSHTVNSQATGVGFVTDGVTDFASTIKAAVSTANLVRLPFMMVSADKGTWVPPEFLRIYDQVLTYNASYRI